MATLMPPFRLEVGPGTGADVDSRKTTASRGGQTERILFAARGYAGDLSLFGPEAAPAFLLQELSCPTRNKVGTCLVLERMSDLREVPASPTP